MERHELSALNGSVVALAHRGDERGFRFSVESAAGQQAVLRPCDRVAERFAVELGVGTMLRLTAGTDEGVLRGVIRVIRWSFSHRMLVVEHPPMALDRRRESRLRTSVPIDIAVRDGRTYEVVTGETRDISEGGLSFRVRSAVVPVGVTAFVLHLATSIVGTMEVLARPSRSADVFRARFVQLDLQDRRAVAGEFRRRECAWETRRRRLDAAS